MTLKHTFPVCEVGYSTIKPFAAALVIFILWYEKDKKEGDVNGRRPARLELRPYWYQSTPDDFELGTILQHLL
ncbi:carbohydrate esterase family 12 protein [Moniliophthora roreri]|nr:carbohydrate esterase family 12 protein [Moniliophthora roreri]